MSYIGIGTTGPNHPLEVEGQVFISNVEQGSATNLVPFEVYSDYTGITISDILEGARQLRLRVTPGVTTSANVNMDMGIEPTNGDYFYISNPVVDTPLGSNAAFRITQAGDVSMGNDLSVTGSITSSTLNVGSVLDVNESNIIAYANVGIGITDPQKPLHVVGNTWITGSLTTPSIVGATLSSPTLVNPVISGALSVSGTITSSALDTGTLSSSTLSVGSIFYVNESINTVSQLASNKFNFYNQAIIDTKGYLFIRGDNYVGQLGLGYTGGFVTEFTRTALNVTDSITRVAFGFAHTMIIAGGKVYGTGENGQFLIYTGGQLGIGNTVNQNTFTANATPVSASEIACGSETTMIIDPNGTVSGTGINFLGQLGTGNTDNKTSFTRSNPVATASEISCGQDHTMIIDTNGTVSGTGYNDLGELGIGSTVFLTDTFTRSNPVATASKISCGARHTMIIDTNGTVSGTGWNSSGQLGIGSTISTSSFTRSNPVKTASKISCGEDHTMIIDPNGTVSGTGRNFFGQLGIGNTTNKNTFTAHPTSPVTNASEISAGQYESTLAIDNNVYTTNYLSGNFIESDLPYGKVGIGITNPTYQLQLSLNSAAKPTSVFWTVASDRRIKEDIVDADLDTCLENVKNLKLRYYKLRDDIIKLDPMFNDSHKLGWIAQEVEEILPKCVTTIPEQYGLTNVKNLDADQIYVNMFGAIQKLIKENEELKADVEALENK